MNPIDKSVRKTEYDLIRTIAMLEVIGLHVFPSTLIMRICSSCVPLFVMLSGCLKLKQNEEFSWNKWLKSILRLVLVFLVSSVFYAFFVDTSPNITDTIRNIVIGHYHLWFLFMIIGLYLCIPIILQIKTNIKIYYLFLGISFFTSIVVPTISEITSTTGLNYILYELANIYIGKGFIIYFILGDLLDKSREANKYLYAIYGLGIISFMLLIFGISNTMIVFLYSITVLALLLCLGSRINHLQVKRILEFLSKQCLIVYVIHAAVIEYLSKYIDIDIWLFIYTVISCFLIATIINYLLNRCRLLFLEKKDESKTI